MPGMNRTGPMGQGPRSGRGMGRCAPLGGEQPAPGFGGGFGFGGGRGFGRGRGYGRGMDRGYWAASWAQPEQSLQAEAESLRRRLSRVEKELDRLRREEPS